MTLDPLEQALREPLTNGRLAYLQPLGRLGDGEAARQVERLLDSCAQSERPARCPGDDARIALGAFAALNRWHSKLTVVNVMAAAGIVRVIPQHTSFSATVSSLTTLSAAPLTP